MDNETITICSTGLASKPTILEPQSGVHFPRVFWDVGRWSIPRWDDGIEDVSAKGLRTRQVRAQASVLAAIIASATMRVVATASPLPHIATSMPTGIKAVPHVAVEAKTLMHWGRSVRPYASLRLVD